MMSKSALAKDGKKPIITVVYNEQTVDCWIDVMRSLPEIITTLASHFKIINSEDYCLRIGITSALLTSENITELKKMPDETVISLCESPKLLAQAITDKLANLDGTELYQALDLLTQYTKEHDFTQYFTSCGGCTTLQRLASKAYSDAALLVSLLFSINNLLGQSLLPVPLVDAGNFCSDYEVMRHMIPIIISLLSKENTYSYLYKQTSTPQIDLTDAFIQNKGLLKWVVSRIVKSPKDLQILYLLFINTLLMDPSSFQQIILVLDFCTARKTISHLMSQSPSPQLARLLVEFQSRIVADYSHGIKKKVDLSVVSHAEALDEIQLFIGTPGIEVTWESIGLLETPADAFESVGVLGLATVHFFAKHNSNFCQQLLAPESHNSCPVLSALIETSAILIDAFGIKSSEAPKAPSPIFLCFEDAFAITFKAFLILWNEVNLPQHSSIVVIIRVSKLLRSHLRYMLSNIDMKGQNLLKAFEMNMLETSITVIRERHATAEIEPLSPSYQNLHETNLKESTQFLNKQRISYMTKGAWFELQLSSGYPFMFCRLSTSSDALNYSLFKSKTMDAGTLLEHSVPIASIKKWKETESVKNAIELEGEDIPDNIRTLAFASRETFKEWSEGFKIICNIKTPLSDESTELLLELTNLRMEVTMATLYDLKIIDNAPVIPALPTDFEYWYVSGCTDSVVGCPENLTHAPIAVAAE